MCLFVKLRMHVRAGQQCWTAGDAQIDGWALLGHDCEAGWGRAGAAHLSAGHSQASLDGCSFALADGNSGAVVLRNALHLQAG